MATLSMFLPVYTIYVVLVSEITFPLALGKRCYVGKRTNPHNKWSYTLTPRDPCACTSLIRTGIANEDNILSEDKYTIRGYLGVDDCPDEEKPIIHNIPANVVQSTDHGVATAMVIWAAPSATDNSGSPTLTSTHSSGQLFPIGETVVSYTAIDLSGNIAIDRFTVIVQDQENPVIANMPENLVQNTDNGLATATVNWTAPSSSDNSGSQLLTMTSTHIPGSAFPIGVSVVSYSAVDASGNTALEEFNVTVQDSENPIIQGVPDTIVQNTDVGLPTATVNWILPTTTDNSGSEPILASTHSPGIAFPIGNTVVWYKATDPSSNAATDWFTVSVIDEEKPVITNMPANITQNTTNGLSQAMVTWQEPLATDNSGTQVMGTTKSPGEYFPVGDTIVQYTAVDPSGNTATEMFAVTVIQHVQHPIFNVQSLSQYDQVPCKHPYKLGMEDGRIKDDQLTASSFGGGDKPKHGRLNRLSDRFITSNGLAIPPTTSFGGWCVGESSAEKWMQVDLGTPISIAGVIMQGRAKYKTLKHWVSKYKVQFSTNGADWQYIMDTNLIVEMEFDGPQEYTNTAVTTLFNSPINAMQVRIHPTEWAGGNVCLRFELFGCKGFCVDPLGMKDGRISDAQLSVSSSSDTNHTEVASRLDGSKAWTGIDGSSPWIKVDFGVSRSVSGTMIQGHSDRDEWVTEYQVDFSNDVNIWQYVKDINDDDMVFTGAFDRNTPVSSLFTTPIMATQLRVHPISWNNHISMRFEVLGCKGLCVDPLGMKDVRILNDQLSHSTAYTANFGASSSRLDGILCWTALTSDVSQWIQVEFSVLRFVSGVILQGRGAHLQWVSRYKVHYNSDGINWLRVTDVNDVDEMIFIGNTDEDTHVTSVFPHMIIVKQVRIHPIEWNGHISLRFEIIGCDCTNSPAGMKDGRIPDAQITASSADGSYVSSAARLDNPFWWAPDTDDQVRPWLQVIFNEVELVVGIVSQGGDYGYITAFTVEYSDDPNTNLVTWMHITDFINWPSPKVFVGNTDRTSHVTNMFAYPISASAMRIRPTANIGYINIRLEILQCKP